MNRQITGRIATYDFSPTLLSRDNLLREGVDPQKITVTGNTVIDALQQVVLRIKNDPELQEKLAADLVEHGYDTSRNRRLVLITGHRRENFGEGFLNICRGIKDLSEKYPEFIEEE